MTMRRWGGHSGVVLDRTDGNNYRHQKFKRCIRSISRSRRSERRWGRSLRDTDTWSSCRRRMSYCRRVMQNIRYVRSSVVEDRTEMLGRSRSERGTWKRDGPAWYCISMLLRSTRHFETSILTVSFTGDDELLETTTPRPQVLPSRRRSSSKITKELYVWFPWGNSCVSSFNVISCWPSCAGSQLICF